MPRPRLGVVVVLLALAAAAAGEDGYESPGRGRLGIGMTSPSPQVQERNALDPEQGVQVAWVFPDTAASRLGIQPGDVIVAVDGEPIRGMGHMVETITSRNAGDPAEITVARDGKRLSLGSAPLSGWPPGMSIPTVDPAWDQAQADRRRSELARRAQGVADLRKQLSEVEDALAERAKQPRDPALAEALAALGALPPWRLSLSWRSPEVAAEVPAEAAPAEAAAPPRTAAGEPWRFDHRFDSSDPP